MKGTRHSEEQIITILKQGEAGLGTAELCRQHGITEQTYYRWKAKYGGMDSGEAKKLGEIAPNSDISLTFRGKRRGAAPEMKATNELLISWAVSRHAFSRSRVGSRIAPDVDDVWACEFAEASAEPGYLEKSQSLFEKQAGAICEVAYSLDNTSKTRAIFEVNKGSNKMSEIDVNAAIAQDMRRVPFQNMVYIADGPSDIPCFSLVSHFGGRTYAVYKARSDKEFQKAYDLQKQQRVEAFGEADYSEGSHTAMWITKAMEDIAERIVRDRTRMLGDELGQPPGHVIEQAKPLLKDAVISSPAKEVIQNPNESPAPKKSPVGESIPMLDKTNSDSARK